MVLQHRVHWQNSYIHTCQIENRNDNEKGFHRAVLRLREVSLQRAWLFSYIPHIYHTGQIVIQFNTGIKYLLFEIINFTTVLHYTDSNKWFPNTLHGEILSQIILFEKCPSDQSRLFSNRATFSNLVSNFDPFINVMFINKPPLKAFPILFPKLPYKGPHL